MIVKEVFTVVELLIEEISTEKPLQDFPECFYIFVQKMKAEQHRRGGGSVVSSLQDELQCLRLRDDGEGCVSSMSMLRCHVRCLGFLIGWVEMKQAAVKEAASSSTDEDMIQFVEVSEDEIMSLLKTLFEVIQCDLGLLMELSRSALQNDKHMFRR